MKPIEKIRAALNIKTFKTTCFAVGNSFKSGTKKLFPFVWNKYVLFSITTSGVASLAAEAGSIKEINEFNKKNRIEIYRRDLTFLNRPNAREEIILYEGEINHMRLWRYARRLRVRDSLLHGAIVGSGCSVIAHGLLTSSMTKSITRIVPPAIHAGVLCFAWHQWDKNKKVCEGYFEEAKPYAINNKNRYLEEKVIENAKKEEEIRRKKEAEDKLSKILDDLISENSKIHKGDMSQGLGLQYMIESPPKPKP